MIPVNAPQREQARKHFDDFVRPRLDECLPAISEAAWSGNSVARQILGLRKSLIRAFDVTCATLLERDLQSWEAEQGLSPPAPVEEPVELELPAFIRQRA